MKNERALRIATKSIRDVLDKVRQENIQNHIESNVTFDADNQYKYCSNRDSVIEYVNNLCKARKELHSKIISLI